MSFSKAGVGSKDISCDLLYRFLTLLFVAFVNCLLSRLVED